MTTRNKIDNVFGPVGTSIGFFLFIIGVVVSYFSLGGLILIVPGAFLGLTSTSSLIDFDKKRIKFSNNFFGIIPVGQWIPVQPDMKLGIKKSNRVWRAYSRGNRTLDVADRDYRIILYGSDCKEIMVLQKTSDAESAKLNLDKLCGQLNIGLKQ